MRVGLAFHHDPARRPPGIDLERLTSLAEGLGALGAEAEVVAPVRRAGWLRGPEGGRIAVRPAGEAGGGRYHILETCYHPGIDLVPPDFPGPVVCRLVRVVDASRPVRDAVRRDRLLAWQDAVRARATAVVFNNPQNLERWRRLYGWDGPTALTPTGCPERLPPPGPDPYRGEPPPVLFLGSLAAGRMVRLLNRLAEALSGQARVHLVGLNKSGLYGRATRLSDLVVDHGPHAAPRLWDYVGRAGLGLALAAGPDDFDNDSSKVYSYLRGGLPVLWEEPILQGRLVEELGMGAGFAHGDAEGMAAGARALLARGAPARAAAMERMAGRESWVRRAETYLRLFERLLDGEPRP